MIFTILKVIGIILLVVLALILTALLCVLFVPVKYRAVGSFDNTDIRAKAHVSWLLPFVCTAYRVCTRRLTDI